MVASFSPVNSAAGCGERRMPRVGPAESARVIVSCPAAAPTGAGTPVRHDGADPGRVGAVGGRCVDQTVKTFTPAAHEVSAMVTMRYVPLGRARFPKVNTPVDDIVVLATERQPTDVERCSEIVPPLRVA